MASLDNKTMLAIEIRKAAQPRHDTVQFPEFFADIVVGLNERISTLEAAVNKLLDMAKDKP